MKKICWLILLGATLSVRPPLVGVEDNRFQLEKKCGCLDLNSAIERVLKDSPLLKIANADIEAKLAEYGQTRLYPNPVFSYELEQSGGNGRWGGWRGGESTYALSQLIELGGKRSSRQKLFSFNYYASVVDYQILQRRVLNELIKSFIDVAANQESLKLIEEQQALANQLLDAIQLKKEAGKACLAQQIKAEIVYSAIDSLESQIRTALEVSKERLAVLWGATKLDFDCVDYPLYSIQPPRPLSDYFADFCDQPELVRAQIEHLAAKESIRLEKSQAIPDLTVTIGYQDDQVARVGGVVLGFAIPLPIFDRNQGNIGRACAESKKIAEQANYLRLILTAKLSSSYKACIQAYQEVERLKRAQLARACQAFDLTQEGYREGKFEYLDVLEAQRLLCDIKDKYIKALVDYYEKKADLDYLSSEID